MKGRNIISMILSVVMILSLVSIPVTTAEAEDVTSNGLAITATNSVDTLTEGVDYSYSNGKWTISTTTPVTISMKSGVNVTDDYIVIDTANGVSEVTLNGISIKNGNENIIDIQGENASTIIVKGQNSLVSTSTSNKEGIYAQKSALTVTSTNGGKLAFEGVYAGIRGYQKPISLEGNVEINVKDVEFGIFLSPYSSSSNLLKIRDNVCIKSSEVNEHAIYNKYGKIDIQADNDEHIVLDLTTDAWGIYGHGIDISGKVTITVNSTEDDGAVYSGGENNPINLSGDITINIESVKNGITAKGDITMDDGVKIENISVTNTYAYGINCEDLVIHDSEVEIESNGYAAITADTVTVSGNSKVETYTVVDTSSSRYGIMYEGKFEVTDEAQVEIKVEGSKTYAVYGSSSNKSDAVDVKENASLTLDGGVRTVYYTEAISISDNAQMIIKNAEEYGVYNADVTVANNAKLAVDSKEYGLRVENKLDISNNAEVTINGTDKAIYSSRKYQVTPDEGKAYEVSIGKTKDSAEVATYYETSGEQSTKAGMTYFHAVSKTPYETTDIEIDYKNEKLVNFKVNGKYTVNDTEVAPENGTLQIDEGWFDTTVKIAVKGDENYAASKPQELVVAARPDAPAISGTYEVDENDNTKFVYTVTQADNAEYKMDDGEWQDSNVFAGITPLSSHKFSIRLKATDTSFASKVAVGEEVTFAKLDGEGTVSLADWIFGDEANHPIPSSDTNGIDKVSYLYKLSSADDSTYSDEKPTEAGTYTVKATFAATETYNEVVATAEFTIKKADKIVGEVPNVDDITDKNVKIEDKKKLEEAKVALEKNLEENKNNYTDELTNAIQKEIKRIENLLNIIKTLETVSKTPVTTDVASIWMWIAILFVSGSCIVVAVAYDKKKQRYV